MLLRFFEEATAKYTSCFLNSPKTYKSFIDLTIGAASPHVNVRDVVKHPIPLPPLAEQHAIVERVVRLLGMVSELETQVSDRKARSDDLMQAVLREAFVGKFNQPQIHTDEHR